MRVIQHAIDLANSWISIASLFLLMRSSFNGVLATVFILESMKMDDTTAFALATRGKFARLCVEVDLTKPLLSK